MTDREVPLREEDLYEARGVVPLARPITQGDIFTGVDIPGFEQQPPAVMIIQHPCSMRTGPVLRPRLTVAAVRPGGRIRDADWQGYVAAMLLPNMLGDGQDYQADFRDVGSVKTPDLKRSTRVVGLTNYGVHILHQRTIYYQTRFTIDVPTLAETFDPIATELELQYEWVEAAIDAALGAAPEEYTLEIITSAESEFGCYLDENDRARRNGLQKAASRADIRRLIRREIIKRYPSNSG
jgi:hypothetical protein